jgi:hypothetical protein
LSLSSDQIEVIVSGWVEDLPEPLSRINVRDIVCELLYSLNVPQNQMVLIMLLILDKYSLDNLVENANEL